IKAAQTLVDLSKQGDEIFIVDMKDSHNIELVNEFTTDLEDIKDALRNLTIGGGTALLDGILLSAEYATKSKNRRKALVIISDGDERDSTFSVAETLNKLSEYDVQLYMIGFPEALSEDKGIFKPSPRKKAVELINRLTSESGGQAYFPKDLTELETIAKKIAADLRSQYIISYQPSNQKRDGSFRHIQVKLVNNSEQYVIRARSGYYAPKEGTQPDKSLTSGRGK
ncbi:MAG: VWA domain-containing protein, partial [Acidobacteriota bacterium]